MKQIFAICNRLGTQHQIRAQQIAKMAACINSEFCCKGFKAPSPAEIEATRRENGTIYIWGGVTIVRLSPVTVVKYGSHVDVAKARNMLFIALRTKCVPVPKVFGQYSYGPFPRKAEDYGGLYDTYIFMSFANGETLEKGWDTYNQPTKISIATQLQGHLEELWNIEAPPG